MPLMGCQYWADFSKIILRAKVSAWNTGQGSCFVSCTETPTGLGSRQQDDYHLSSFAAYLVAINSDPTRVEVAHAQAYFAMKNRQASDGKPCPPQGESTMRTEIRLFNLTNQQIRIHVDDNGKPWFVLADICKVLQLGNTTMVANRIPKEQKGISQAYTPGGKQKLITVTEAGLYRVVLRSDSPRAEPMITWVTEEVLPSISKHGAYLVPAKIEEILTDPDTIIRLATELKNERLKIAELEPAAYAWQSIANAEGDYSVADAAKLLSRNSHIDTGQRRLFDYMKRRFWIFRSEGAWHACQEKIDSGLLAMKAHPPHWSERRGEWVNSAPQVRVTPKGLEKLHTLMAADVLEVTS
jgi:prophage antirepressor-like protein